MARVLRARGAAIAWGGLESNELNALARLAGHPFAPDLPEWMNADTKGDGSVKISSKTPSAP